MGSKRFDLPGIDQTLDPKVRRPLERMKQALQQLLGYGGDPDFAALTLNDARRGVLDGFFPSGGSDTELDLTPPPTPTGLATGAALTHVFVEWDPPAYTQGHGHGQTNIYGVQRDPASTDPLPTFSDAVLVYTAPGFLTVAAIPSDANRQWHIWIKWQSLDGVESVSPAGGTNGSTATTGVDVKQLLDSLTNAATNPALNYSKIGFRADLFYIAPEATYSQETAPTGTADGELWFQPSTGVTKTWDNTGGTWEPFDTPFPFIVNTMPTTINGVAIPAGVYMNAAFIYDLTAAIARLGTAWIDDAMVAELDAIKLTVGDGTVGGDLKSTVFTSNVAGWRIRPNGTAEFNNVVVRGGIYASFGLIGGAVIDADGVESTGYSAGTAGWRIDNTTEVAEFYNIVARGDITASRIEVGSSPAISGTTMTGSGAVVNDTGTFALGDSTTNITYDGSVLTLNGEIATTKNLVANTATTIAAADAAAWGVVTATITVTSDDIPVGASDVPIVVIGSQDTLAVTFFDLGVNQGPLYTAPGNLVAAQDPNAGLHTYTKVYFATPGTYTFSCANHGAGDAADVLNTRQRTIVAFLAKR